MPTTDRGLRFPAASESPNGPLQVGNLAADVDAQLTALEKIANAAATGRSPITVTTKKPTGTALTGVINLGAVDVPTRVVWTALGRAGFDDIPQKVSWDWISTPGSATSVAQDDPNDQVSTGDTQWATVVSSLTMDLPAGVAATAQLRLRCTGEVYNRGAVEWHRTPIV